MKKLMIVAIFAAMNIMADGWETMASKACTLDDMKKGLCSRDRDTVVKYINSYKKDHCNNCPPNDLPNMSLFCQKICGINTN